jgi:hypothetical protein
MGPATITKLLGLKRPKLVPLCDLLVLFMIGVSVPTESERRHQRPGKLLEAIDHLRIQGRANLQTLQAIQAQLRDAGYERSLARILDALLWSAHPSADPSHSGRFQLRWAAS